MKTLLAICAMILSHLTWAADTAPVKGKILEIQDVETYSYLRLKTETGETWAAVRKAGLKKGATVTIYNVMVMNNFESKTLKKTFPSILFGTLEATPGTPPGKSGAPEAQASSVETVDQQVPKATGANAYTVAEIVTKAGALKDKPVLVRGKVVKFNPDIMGKNWLHLRDGSGSAANKSNDILVTTGSRAKLGDIVTVNGVVRTDKDFGAGYVYKVIIEDATLQQ